MDELNKVDAEIKRLKENLELLKFGRLLEGHERKQDHTMFLTIRNEKGTYQTSEVFHVNLN